MRTWLLFVLLLAPLQGQADSWSLLKASALLNVEDGSMLENPAVLVKTTRSKR